MRAIDLSKLLKPYENKWVALTKDEEKVICSGKSAKKVYNEALRKGYEEPILTKVLPFDKSFVPCT